MMISSSARRAAAAAAVLLAACDGAADETSAAAAGGETSVVASTGSSSGSSAGGADATGSGTSSGGDAAGGTAAGGLGAGGEEPLACDPNETEPCSCEAPDAVGGRRCAADGSFWGACECIAYGSELVVSTTAQGGGIGSDDSPLTLDEALDEIAARAAEGLPEGGLVVWLEGGTYRLTETLKLEAEHSGTEGRPVVFRSRPGEEVRLTGSVVVEPGASSAVDPTSAVWDRLPIEHRDRVRAIDLAALGVEPAPLARRGGPCGSALGTNELFIGGARQPLARWPDADDDSHQSAEAGETLTLRSLQVPEVGGTYELWKELDGVHAFRRSEPTSSGLQYHLYRKSFVADGIPHQYWFLTTATDGEWPANTSTDPWWAADAADLTTLERWNGGVHEEVVVESPPDTANHGFAQVAGAISPTEFVYAGDRPGTWSDPASVWFHGLWYFSWYDCHVRAASITPEQHKVTLADTFYAGIRGGQPYYAYNIPEEITQPGEWWIDPESRMLYVLPTDDFDDVPVEIAVVGGPVVRLGVTRYVELRDLHIEISRGPLVQIQWGSHNALVGLTLRGAGNEAVRIDGDDVIDGERNGHNLVRGCHVFDAGNGGVALETGDRASLRGGGETVEQSHLHDLNRWEMTYRPAVNVVNVGHTVRHNHIHSLPHQAINFDGNEHLIELNEIHDVGQFTDDAGAIYAYFDWGGRGNVVRHNLIRDVDSALPEHIGVQGIYLDGYFSGVRVEGNILSNVSGFALFSNGGRDNVFASNIVAHAWTALANASGGLAWTVPEDPDAPPTEPEQLVDELIGLGYRSSLWATEYPECAAIPEDWTQIPGTSWAAPENTTFDGNVLHDTEHDVAATPATLAYFTPTGNVEAAASPFVDEANGDLTPDPAAGLPDAVLAIPFAQIGIVPP